MVLVIDWTKEGFSIIISTIFMFSKFPESSIPLQLVLDKWKFLKEEKSAILQLNVWFLNVTHSRLSEPWLRFNLQVSTYDWGDFLVCKNWKESFFPPIHLLTPR